MHDAADGRNGGSGAHAFHFVRRMMLPLIFWLVPTEADVSALAFGIPAIVGTAWASMRLAPPRGRVARPFPLVSGVPRFLGESLLGGIDVARRALQPSMPLKPGWLAIPTSLPAGAPRVAIGSEFSLMPGTLVAGSTERELLVHCLDVDAPVLGKIAKEEARLIRAIGKDAAGEGP